MKVAPFLLVLLSGCENFDEHAFRPTLPPLPEAAAKPCPVPGIGTDALAALVEHRTALIDCAGRQSALIVFYGELRRDLGPSVDR